MPTITTEQIATNRYAPTGADAINLYDSGLASGLTFGQLVQAVCIRAGMAYEAESVTKSNRLSLGTTALSEMNGWMSSIARATDANGASLYASAKTYFASIGIVFGTDVDCPDFNSYDHRMNALNALKAKMDALTLSQQQEMIDLQTLVNRRDVAYNTATNTFTAIADSMNNNAYNF